MAYKLRGKTYHADITWTDPETGEVHRIRESLKTGDEKMARIRHNELEASLYRGTFVASTKGGVGGGLTVAKAYDRLMAGLWSARKAESTIKSAAGQFAMMLKEGLLKADDPVSAITDQRLEELTKALLQSGIAASTVNHRLWLVRALLQQGVKEGAIKALPAIPTNERIGNKNARVRFLSRAEELAMLEHVAKDERLAVLYDALVLLLDTGGRLMEVMGMRREDVELDDAMIRLQNHKGGGEYRNVPLTGRCVAVLARRLRKSDAVFPVPQGFKDNYWMFALNKQFDEVRKALSMEDVTLHTMRHTYATRLLASGTDLRTAMALLGHKTPQMTLRYAKPIDENKRAAASRIESYVDPVRARS